MSIQLSIVILYILLLFGISLYVKRRAGQNPTEYLFAGRKFSAGLVAVSITGMAVGAASTVGVAESATKIGLSAGWYNGAWSIGAIIMGIVAAGRYRSLDCTTIPELFERCYDKKARVISVIGLWSPTADLNTEAAWAIVVFVLIMYYKIKTNGILSYLKGLLDPIFIMAPINVLSEVSTPVSMAFRHFGNILSGTVISTLLYWALASLSHVIFGWLPGALSQIQLFQIGIPAFTGLYFDWFGGCIQAFIFCTLTAIFIKRAAGEE